MLLQRVHDVVSERIPQRIDEDIDADVVDDFAEAFEPIRQSGGNRCEGQCRRDLRAARKRNEHCHGHLAGRRSERHLERRLRTGFARGGLRVLHAPLNRVGLSYRRVRNSEAEARNGSRSGRRTALVGAAGDFDKSCSAPKSIRLFYL